MSVTRNVVSEEQPPLILHSSATEDERLVFFKMLLLNSGICGQPGVHEHSYPSVAFVHEVVGDSSLTSRRKLFKLAQAFGRQLYEDHRHAVRGVVRSLGEPGGFAEKALSSLLYNPELFQYFNHRSYAGQCLCRSHDFQEEDKQPFSEVLVKIRNESLYRDFSLAVKNKKYDQVQWLLEYTQNEPDIILRKCPLQYAEVSDTNMIRLILDHQALAKQSYRTERIVYQAYMDLDISVTRQTFTQLHQYDLCSSLDKNSLARDRFLSSIIDDMIDGKRNKWHADAISVIAQHSKWKERLFDLLITKAKASAHPYLVLQKALDRQRDSTLFKIFAEKRGFGRFFKCRYPEAGGIFKRIRQVELDLLAASIRGCTLAH